MTSEEGTSKANEEQPKLRSITFILPSEADDNEIMPHNVQTSDGENRTQDYQNINPDVYYKNQSTCLLCGVKENFLAHHYAKYHHESEVFVARLSPQMAEKLRSQNEKFIIKPYSRKMGMCGLCYFCEENKTMGRVGWREHILRHTSEKGYACSQCHGEFTLKNEHENKKCDGNPVDISKANSSDGSLVGFMCQECNY